MHTRVLCNWRPADLGFDFSNESEGNQQLLESLFQAFLLSIGYDVTIWGTYPPGNEWKGLFTWHQDGGKFIIWSNVGSAVVELANGELLEVCDGDVILLDNSWHHTRFPVPPGRWLIRTNFLKKG